MFKQQLTVIGDCGVLGRIAVSLVELVVPLPGPDCVTNLNLYLVERTAVETTSKPNLATSNHVVSISFIETY